MTNNPANYGDKAIRASSLGEMYVCLVITKEVNQEETQMPDTHKGIHINELT